MSDLRALAEAATPGPWEWQPSIEYRTSGRTRVAGPVVLGPVRPILRGHSTMEDADAAFIAACDPKTVLSLLDRIATLEAELRRRVDV